MREIWMLPRIPMDMICLGRRKGKLPTERASIIEVGRGRVARWFAVRGGCVRGWKKVCGRGGVECGRRCWVWAMRGRRGGLGWRALVVGGKLGTSTIFIGGLRGWLRAIVDERELFRPHR